MADELLNALLNGGGSRISDSLGSDRDLSLFARDIAENDPYRIASAPILNAKLDMSTWSPATRLGVSFGQSFLGTLLNQIGRNQEANQLAKVADVLPTLYKNPSSVDVPEGVDASAFGKLKNSAIRDLFSQEQKLQQSKALSDFNTQSEIERIKAIAPIEVETEIQKRKRLLELAGGVDPELEGKRRKEIRDLESDYYKRIVDLPQFKLLADIDSNFKALQDLSKQDSKASDIGLISTVARIRDPNSTVREGEYAINSDTQAYLDKVVGNWQSIVKGESRLTPSDKNKIIASVVPKYNELGQSYLQVRNPLIEALKRQGGNPENVPTMDFQPFDLNSLTSSEIRTLPNGKKVRVVLGK